jgi:ABC-2 type transport system ATP-binding protein
MSDAVIELTSIAKRFGHHEVLTDVTMSVERGQTFAFLGRNGTGKTTSIRMMLGLLRPDSGEVRVLGLDPKRQATAIRQRVGFLAEDQAMWGWMRVEQLLGFMAPFYPTWDTDLARKLVGQFELLPKARVKHLSKGQTVRLGLLLALAHRPELVILDDPTLGLDPIARKEFIRDVIDHLQGGGATVFFSSHLLYEVEPVADVVAILDRGRIVRAAATEELRNSVKRLILPAEQFVRVRDLPGTLDVRVTDRRAVVVVDDVDSATRVLAVEGITPEVVGMNLDEIFEAYVIGKREEIHDSQPALERVA